MCSLVPRTTTPPEVKQPGDPCAATTLKPTFTETVVTATCALNGKVRYGSQHLGSGGDMADVWATSPFYLSWLQGQGRSPLPVNGVETAATETPVKFPEPDLTIKRRDGKTGYNTPIGTLPSVTTILGATSSPEAKHG